MLRDFLAEVLKGRESALGLCKGNVVKDLLYTLKRFRKFRVQQDVFFVLEFVYYFLKELDGAEIVRAPKGAKHFACIFVEAG